jgi:hypothetical protein
MARKPNYRFERHERERIKAAKKAARAEAKAERASDRTADTGPEPAQPSASETQESGKD